ncbi:MAG: hypothetical protein ORN52_11575 [Beijerinckiaceae bacterium]|nr:hypothetical protein [Beijerinckiaceae bacterium]
MSSTVIEVALTDLEESEEDRIEQLVDTLANDVLPSLAEAAGVSGTTLAARLMIEMSYIVGFTHHPVDALDLLTSAGQAIRAGIGDNEQSPNHESKEAQADDVEADIATDETIISGTRSDRLH